MPENDSPSSGNFEHSLAELETIVRQLEDGEVGLAEALGRYEQGVKLLKQCYTFLEGAERKIELLTGVDAQGNPITRPFDDAAEGDLEQKAQSRGKRRSAAAARPSVKPPAHDSDDDDAPGGLF